MVLTRMLSKTTTVFGCWEGEWSLSLELAQHQPWAGEVVSFAGGREILKICSGMRSMTAFDKGMVLKWFALRHMPRSGRRPK